MAVPLACTIRHRPGGEETGGSADKRLNAKVSHQPSLERLLAKIQEVKRASSPVVRNSESR